MTPAVDSSPLATALRSQARTLKQIRREVPTALVLKAMQCMDEALTFLMLEKKARRK